MGTAPKCGHCGLETTWTSPSAEWPFDAYRLCDSCGKWNRIEVQITWRVFPIDGTPPDAAAHKVDIKKAEE